METLRMFIVLLMAVLLLPVSSDAQIRKTTSYLMRKLGTESAEKASRSTVCKTATSAGRAIAATAGRKAVTHGIKKTTASLATNLAKRYGDDAIEQIVSKVDARTARRLAFVVDEIPIHQKKELLELLAKHPKPDSVVSYLYKHRAELAAGTLIGGLVLQPDKVLQCTADIVSATGQSIVRPVAKPLGNWMGFTLFIVGSVLVCSWTLRNYLITKDRSAS